MHSTNVKINLSKTIFYSIIFLLFLFTLANTIYLLSAMLINTKIYDVPKGSSQELIKASTSDNIQWMIGKLISYITNSFLAIAFLVYVSFARRRIKIGYVFIMLWSIVFVAISFIAHILPGSHDEIIRLVSGVIMSISSGLIVLILLDCYYDIYLLRKSEKRNLYKTYKKKMKREKGGRQ